MNEIKEFYDLEAWQKAHFLILEIYKLTKSFPREELFGIVSQVRRAAVSVTANIAEGFGRYHFRDKSRFYVQARGSVAEVQNFLLVCKDLSLLNKTVCTSMIEKYDDVRRLLNGLIRSMDKSEE